MTPIKKKQKNSMVIFKSLPHKFGLADFGVTRNSASGITEVATFCQL